MRNKQVKIATTRQPGEVLDVVVEYVVIDPLFKAAICRYSETEMYAVFYQIDNVTPEVGTKGTITILSPTTWRFDPLVSVGSGQR